MTKGRFIPDSKIPVVEEIDRGNGITELVITDRNEHINNINRSSVLDVYEFLPRGERIIEMVPIKKKKFPWHDALAYAITAAPTVVTLLLAKEMLMSGTFVPMFILSTIWIWLIFLLNTKWKRFR